MKLMIYNTLTRKKETFTPVHPGRVHVYVCGPTVYSEPHIGHAKSYISFDVIVRYFRYLGYIVKYVQNITDVGHLTDDADEGEDKISNEAKRLRVDPMEIAQKFTWSYFDAMDALKIVRPDISPHATGHIIQQIEMVKTLLSKGFAYEVNGSVYFDISRFNEYGKLSGRKTEELETGTRIGVNPEKKHPNDFALWKKAETGHLMKWPSPWGEGYPGWHIECSAMAIKYLGETFDIHGGGVDNIFPHHECEIAQSEAATGKPFAKYWLHNNMVTVNGMKMGKSKGNYISIEDALTRYSAETIRYFILSSHYRNPLDVSDEALTSAAKGIERLGAVTKLLNEASKESTNVQNFIPPFDPIQYQKRFEAAMNDDFNTPQAIASIFEFSKGISKYLHQTDKYDKTFLENIFGVYSKLAGDVLGILPEEQVHQIDNSSPELVDKIINFAMKLRNEFRRNKQWELSDKIRDELAKLGIKIIDQPDGSSEWRKE
jgi:cysteinyl-tRNA synthetase